MDFGEDHKEQDPHLVRIGWSLDSTSFQLGIGINMLSLLRSSDNMDISTSSITVLLSLVIFSTPQFL